MRLKSPDEIQDAFDLGLDIEFYLYGVRYYIGAPQGTSLISWNDGYAEVEVQEDSKLLHTEFNGNTVIDNWRDIEIISM